MVLHRVNSTGKRNHWPTNYENLYNERDKTESNRFASEYINHYLTQEPIPGITFEYEFAKKYLDGITLDEINNTARQIIRRDNRVVIVEAPEKENFSIPAAEQVRELIAKTESSALDPYVDKLKGTALMDEKPARGKILFTKKKEDLGITELTLANGAKVILKSTDFKNDEVLFRAISPGGYSVFPESDFMSASNALQPSFLKAGWRIIHRRILINCFPGRNCTSTLILMPIMRVSAVHPSRRISESMLQLFYLYFTQPRKDADAFQSFISKQKGIVTNLLSDPENYFFDQFMRASGHSIIPGLKPSQPWRISKRSISTVFMRYTETGSAMPPVLLSFL